MKHMKKLYSEPFVKLIETENILEAIGTSGTETDDSKQAKESTNISIWDDEEDEE